MKKAVLFFAGISMILFSCTKKIESNIVEDYNRAFNERDFEKIDNLISDTIKLIDYHGKVLENNKEGYFDRAVYWGELYDSKSEILSMIDHDSIVKTVETDSNLYYQFLYGQKMKMKFKYTISDDRIVKVEFDTMPGFHSFTVPASKRYGEFAQWIFHHYPEDIIIFDESTLENQRKMKKYLEEYLN